MKLPLILTTLLLTASPALADDYLHLKCEENIDINVLHAGTSEFIKKEVQVRFGVYRIDIIDKTLKGIALDGKQSLETCNIEIGNDRLAYSEIQDVVNGDSRFQLKIDLLPPFDLVSKGRFISNELPIMMDWKIQGICKEVDPSVFEKALNQPN